jgi:fatty acid-binding protein DegV
MKIAISAETTVDLSPELIKQFNIEIIPFKVHLGEECLEDGKITLQDIFDYVDKTGQLPRTSAVNAFEYEEYFRKLKEKYDAVIHFSLSSELSSSCGNAKLASQEVENVFVVDSAHQVSLFCFQLFKSHVVVAFKVHAHASKLYNSYSVSVSSAFIYAASRYSDSRNSS